MAVEVQLWDFVRGLYVDRFEAPTPDAPGRKEVHHGKLCGMAGTPTWVRAHCLARYLKCRVVLRKVFLRTGRYASVAKQWLCSSGSIRHMGSRSTRLRVAACGRAGISEHTLEAYHAALERAQTFQP